MALTLLNTTSIGVGANKDILGTSLGVSNNFMISLFHNSFYNAHSDCWRAPIEKFTGIMLDNLALEFSTPWGDAGGAQIGKKVEGYANSKFIKMLAGQSDNGFNPFICSDAWTQKKVAGDASPIKVTLKFKAYDKDIHGCTNYNDIIKFLILICSPIKSATGLKSNNEADKKILEEMGITDEIKIGNLVGDNLSNAVGGVGNLKTQMESAINNFKNLQNSSDDTAASTIRNIANSINTIYNSILSKTSDGKNNANFTVLFNLSYKVNNESIKNIVLGGGEDGKATIVSNDIDWIVTNFSFKPSTEFDFDNKDKIPKPLWVDFDLSLETRLSLSNRYIHNLLSDTKY
jgi:hypothetical protein